MYEKVLLSIIGYKELVNKSSKYNRDAARNAIEQEQGIPLYEKADIKMKAHKCEEEVMKLHS